MNRQAQTLIAKPILRRRLPFITVSKGSKAPDRRPLMLERWRPKPGTGGSEMTPTKRPFGRELSGITDGCSLD